LLLTTTLDVKDEGATNKSDIKDSIPTSVIVSNAGERAVSYSFLKQFIMTVPTDYTTGDVVFKIIVPNTAPEKVSNAI
jgi:hypothetical protein